jgi:hypothetical protein
MKVNLVKELERDLKSKKKVLNEYDLLSNAQKLLDYDGQRDREILSKLSPHSAFARAEKERGALIELENHQNYYAGKVYTATQIIELGAKYRLKFLPMNLYTGHIDVTVLAEIKALERAMSKNATVACAERRNSEEVVQKDIKFDSHQLSTSFYILAPASVFKISKARAFSIPLFSDPLMFYQIDNENYRLVKKWGTDFTILRRLKGIIYANTFNFSLSIVILPLLFFLRQIWYDSGWWFFGVAACIITFCILMGGDWHYAFFGKSYTTDKSKF